MGVLNETTSEKLLNFIEKNGLLDAINLVGSYDKIKSILHSHPFSDEQKIKFIQDIINKYGGFGFGEIRLDPIFYGRTDNESKWVEYLGNNKAIIQVWDNEFETDLGEFGVSYHNLSSDILNEIFVALAENLDEIQGLNGY